MNKPDSENTDPGWFVYIIKASDGRLYTGVTTDVARRFGEHSGTQRGARFFRGRQPVEVVFTESHPDRSSAQRREADIKRLSRGLKLDLIGRQSPEHTRSIIKPPRRPC